MKANDELLEVTTRRTGAVPRAHAKFLACAWNKGRRLVGHTSGQRHG